MPIWALAVTAVWVARYHSAPAEWSGAFRTFFLHRTWSLAALLLNWAGFLAALAALPGVLAVARWAGRAAWRWLGRGRPAGPGRSAGRLLEAHVIGLGVVGTGILGAGLCGLLFLPPAPWSIVGLACLGAADLARRPGQARWWARAIPAREAAAAVSRPVRWCLGLAVLVTVAHVFSIETGWDAMTYHLRFPEMYGLRHRVFDVWHYPTAVFPALAEMTFTGVRMAGGDTLVRLLVAATALLALASAGRLAGELGVRAGYPAAVLAASPLFLLLATRAYVDLAVMLFAAMGWIAWLEWRRTGARRAAAVAGWCAGCAVACKYSAGLLAVAIGFAAIGTLKSRQGRRAASIWLVAGAAPVLPWLLRAWLLRGNPVHPFLSGIMGMPAARFPDLALPFEGVSPHGSIFAHGVFARLHALLFHDGHFDGPLAPAIVALLPAVLLVPLPGAAARVRTGLVAFILGWLVLCPDLRFLAPVAVPLCVLAAVALGRLGRRRLATTILVVVLEAGLAASAIYTAGYQWKTDAPFAMPLGFETKRDKLELGLRPAPFFAYAVRAVGEIVPRDGRILAVCLIHTYYLEREALADVHYGTAHVTRVVEAGRTEGGIARRMRQLGLGWVLAAEGVCAEYAATPGYFAAPRPGWNAWIRFLAARAEPVWQTDGFVLYRVGRRHAARAVPAAPPVDMLACLPARQAVEAGQPARALALLGGLPPAVEATGTPWLIRGRAHLMLREWEAAAGAFRTAARRGVDSPELGLGLARALYAAGRGTEAFPYAARALAVHPRSAYACGLLAVLLAEQGRIDDARALARRAVRLDPGEPAYRRLLQGLEPLAGP